MAANWRVIGQREFEDLRTNGQFVPMVEITFELTASGNQGTVRIPKRDYVGNPDRVRDEIEQVASTMAAVENL